MGLVEIIVYETVRLFLFTLSHVDASKEQQKIITR